MHGLGAQPGTGIPNPYPLAINQPLDRAYLRPLQEPLYDTEVLDFTSPAQQLTYFQRPVSQSTAALAITKTAAETNLNQSSMLDYPREFSILGFNIEFDSTIGIKSIAAAYRRAFFLFTFSGRRPYLQIPFQRIPQGMGLEGFVSSTVSAGANDSGKTGSAKNGMGHIANYYRFNLGRSALKIKPGEAFNGSINWPVVLTSQASGAAGTGLETTLNTITGQTQSAPAGWFVRLYIVGLQWSPL